MIMHPSTFYDFKGQVAIVTGSARGLGREIALALAKCGASIILADISQTERTEADIKEIGAPFLCITTDVTDPEAVERLYKKTITKFNRIDILINNAGVSQLSYTPTEESDIEEWDRVLAVNLRGTFLCSKFIGRHMIHNNGGSILNIASTAGITGVPRAPAYCASKAGVILLTKALAIEWSRYNIRVNAIAPHYLKTDLTEGLRSDERAFAGLTRQIPMKRFGEAYEIIGTILLLISKGSTYTTGSVFVVDGGYLAQ